MRRWKWGHISSAYFLLVKKLNLGICDGEVKGGSKVNHVGIVGRITKDLELRQVAEGRMTTSFVLAINRNFRNSQGTIDADFIQCVVWGKLAENVVHYCGKGSLIGVTGRLQTRMYVNKDNQKVYATEVLAEDVRFYVLKQPENGSIKDAEQDVPAHFVLPDEDVSIAQR